MICNKCGKEIDDKSEFCQYCGVKIYNIHSIEFEEKKCHNCGILLKGDEKKCPNCKISLNSEALNDTKLINKKVIIYIILVAILICVSIFSIVKINDIPILEGVVSESNLVGKTKEGKEKKVNISEENIKQKIKMATELIKTNYHTALTDIREIKIIYNYKEKTIENLYISVKFYQKLQVGYKTKSQYTWASISKENVYNDLFITGIDAKMLFQLENLNNNECLITEDDNILLTQIKEYMIENGEINHLKLNQQR